MKHYLAAIQVACALMCLTTSCLATDEIEVPVVTSSPAISVADKEIKTTIQLQLFRTLLHDGDHTGQRTYGIFCANSKRVVYKAASTILLKESLWRSVRKSLEQAGYPVYETTDSAFGGQESTSPDFQLGATLKDTKESLCVNGADATGGAYYKILWELFSTKQQRVIFSKTTEGSYQTSSSQNTSEIYDAAKINAVNNLLADPDFVAAVQNEYSTVQSVVPAREIIEISAPPPLSGGAAKNISELQSAVVTIDNNQKLGSGFYIDQRGYILTTRHVVQSAKYVRVRLSSKETMVGEVLRTDPARDIALIKTDPVKLQPLSLRETPGVIAEEVYAIGTPLTIDLAGTVSKGILSGEREPHGVPFLQSDVSVTFGSAGGPLFDSKGAVIGLTQSGIPISGNINFFIPITDALKKLAIKIR